MFNPQTDIAGAFRRSGLRRTPQRYAVLERLTHAGHATADEICQAINRVDPRASRATVYNNLHALMRAGLIQQVAVDGKAVRFDANIHRHHHFVCDACGRVEDIAWFDLPLPPRRSPLGPRTFRNYEVVFRGICERCSKNEITKGKHHGKSR